MVETQCRRKTLTGMKLPPDVILFHILPRLPAQSLLRFMSVSKQWHSFLKKRMFSDTHLLNVTNNVDQQYHHKFLVLSSASPFKFCTINCEAPNDGLSVSRPFPFKASHSKMSIIASCNGLVCVGMHQKSRWDMYETEYTDLILWNPLTGEYKTLSKANSHKDCYETSLRAFGLYYSSFDDDYKLLRVPWRNSDFYIYSLKNDAWRKVCSENDFENIAYCWRSGYCWMPISTCLNENVYYLKQDNAGSYSEHTYSVIRFDTKTEKFKEIPTPSFRNQALARFSFTAQNGCIHFCVILNVGELDPTGWCIELWSMDGDEKWTKVSTYSWIPCLEIGPQQCLIHRIRPVHLMRNGSLLMQYTFRDGLYQLDVKKHSNNSMLTPYISKRTYIPQKAEYIETLVSPNQYMK